MEPVFVGRKALFDLVKGNIEGVLNKRHSTGSTICITGPPGAGKTAFLEELKARCREEDFAGVKTHCVQIHAGDFHSPGCVIATLAKAADEFQYAAGAEGRLSALGLSVGHAGISFAWEPGRRLPFSSFPEDLFKEGAEGLLKRGDAFILVVDEAQKIAPTPGRKANHLLASLHEGVGLPVVTVLAGLPNTPSGPRQRAITAATDGSVGVVAA